MDEGIECSPSLSTAAGTVNFNRNGESVPDLTGKVHQLPCCIKYDGPTSVAHYFKPKDTGVEIDGLRIEEAYFRGRKLQGTTIPLPQGYSGFVLRKETSAENAKCWEMNAKFQNLSVWNHDGLPSHDDAFMRSFHWFAVSKALHQPASAEDLESILFCMEQE
ncbi:OLC1v1025278C1 [Oldenlandia corymbosa var. corymbosa]|uniref:OLC1v1025278C1 n=1 Tax=Oldenlandia corymbosa var. corymbosa TaxID=529605 RepID=A0AAV1C7Q7_OLDCO|nr:OLC1v1025278C1 [Oldenlandia corymbosa var. corymbosa]